MQRGKLKVMAMTMAIALGVTSFGAISVDAKAKKPTIAKKLSIKVSKSKTLTVKNVKASQVKKITWKVSNPRLLKLSKKNKLSVKLTAKKTGKTTVKAVVNYGKKKTSLKTTVTITAGVSNANNATKAPVVTEKPKATPSATEQPTATPTIEPTEGPEMNMKVSTKEALDIMETLPEASTYKTKVNSAPDIMTKLDGSKVENKVQMVERQKEISAILQRYMYGVWRDGSEETVEYSISGKKMTISITRGDVTKSFIVNITLPSTPAPEGGYPVMVDISMGASRYDYLTKSGYALISFNYTDVCSDGSSRKGLFYDLYPYDSKDWRTQTGSIMAWAWGASKVCDALEAGAGKELNISLDKSIVTGVSRCGKAAACAGAFERRFTLSMPVCSGYGGMTMSRYKSNEITYNLLPEFENDPKAKNMSDLSQWKSTGGNENIGSLQGNNWFVESYKSFKAYVMMPFDAHFIAAMTAERGRYLLIVTGINSDMWSSPPGFWWTYNEALPVYKIKGIEDNIGIQMHLDLHGIETIDLCKALSYLNYHVDKTPVDTSTWPAPWNEINKDWKLADLKTCIFASEANEASYRAGFPGGK